jgi:chaperonin GroES
VLITRNDIILNEEEPIMKLVPLGDKVVLKQLEAEETTKSGIVLPGQAKEKPQQAEVIAVGPGGMVDGKEVTMQVKAGDKVIYSKYAGTDVKLGEDEYVVVKQNDIVAIVED